MDNNIYTAVPTKLMLLLDNRLQSILFNLIQLSSAFAGKDGFFYRSNSDLQKAFGCSKHVVIAAIETLYRYDIISVRSIGFIKGRRRTNYYRVNFENFNKWDNQTLLELYNLPSEKRISILNYNSKDFKVTYTNNEKGSPVASNEAEVTTIHVEHKNGSSSLKNTLNEVVAIAPSIERRCLENSVDRITKIRTNSTTLIERLKQTRNWSEFQDKIKLYEDWLDRCCRTLENGKDLKKELYHAALHSMDSIRFEDEAPIDTEIVANSEVEDDFADCPLMDSERLALGITENQKTKLYVYKGDEAKGEKMTIGDCLDYGYNVRLLYDDNAKIFYCPPI